MTFPPVKNCKTVITPNRQPCFWHVQITCPNNTGWPVTSPVLFNQAKNSRDKALKAKSGQKHGHYLALRRSCGVGNCLKIFFWPLDVIQQLSREILLRGAAREGKEPQNRKQWDEVGSLSFSGVAKRSDGREDGVEVGGSERRCATQAAEIWLQSTLVCQVYRGPCSVSHVHTSIRRIWSKTSCKQMFYRGKRWKMGTHMSHSSLRLWTLSDDLDFFKKIYDV